MVNATQYFVVKLLAISTYCGVSWSGDEAIGLDTGVDATRLSSEMYNAVFQSFNSKKTASLAGPLIPDSSGLNYVFRCTRMLRN